jgi:hypothetical protein
MIICLDTPFNIGDIVCSKLNKEYTYIINNFNILQVDDSGTCNMYSIDCGLPNGDMTSFRPYEIDIVLKINQEDNNG